jgi:drug/metabolite transporter (DMT)-like permease
LPALFYAVTINVSPLALTAGASVALLLAVRFLFNMMVSGVFIAARPASRAPLPGKQRIALLTASLALMGQTFALMTALKNLPVSIAVTLFFTFPIISYLIERLRTRTRLEAVAMMAFAVALTGVWMLSHPGSGQDWSVLSIVWALLAAMFQSMLHSASEYVRDVRGWKMVAYTSALPAIVFGVMAIGEDIVPSLAVIGWCILAALTFCFGVYFFYSSVRVNGAVRTANLLYLEPVVAIILGMLIHGEVLTLKQLGGIALVACGSFIIEFWEIRRKVVPVLQ